MAAPDEVDVFNDPSLFTEFEKEREPCDRLMLQTLSKNVEAKSEESATTDSDENDSCSATSDSESEQCNPNTESQPVSTSSHKEKTKIQIKMEKIAKDQPISSCVNGTISVSDSEEHLKNRIKELEMENILLFF